MGAHYERRLAASAADYIVQFVQVLNVGRSHVVALLHQLADDGHHPLFVEALGMFARLPDIEDAPDAAGVPAWGRDAVLVGVRSRRRYRQLVSLRSEDNQV